MRLMSALVLVLITAGCAAMKNTPIQDYVLEKGRACEWVSSGWKLSRVDAVGNYWVQGEGPSGPSQFRQCMQEQYAKQPFNEWLKIQQRQTSSVVGGPPPPVARQKFPPIIGETVWKPGYTWAYRYETPQGNGAFTWIMDREETLDGTTFYVLRTGTREIYIRKSDLAYHMDKVGGEVETRFAPPTRFVSVAPGEKWDFAYVREVPKDRTTQNLSRTCESSGPETITVPAGTFDTVKTTCTNSRTGDLVFEGWYAPAAKQTVRERTLFSFGWRERELIGIRLYPDRLQ